MQLNTILKHAIKHNFTLNDLDNEDRKQKPPYFRDKTHKMHEIWLPRVGYIPWGLDIFYLTMWFLHSATHSLLFRSFDWTMFTSACQQIGTGISFTEHNASFEVRYPRGFICVPTNCSLVRHDVGEECQMKMFTLSIFAQKLNGVVAICTLVFIQD